MPLVVFKDFNRLPLVPFSKILIRPSYCCSRDLVGDLLPRLRHCLTQEVSLVPFAHGFHSLAP